MRNLNAEWKEYVYVCSSYRTVPGKISEIFFESFMFSFTYLMSLQASEIYKS